MKCWRRVRKIRHVFGDLRFVMWHCDILKEKYVMVEVVSGNQRMGIDCGEGRIGILGKMEGQIGCSSWG